MKKLFLTSVLLLLTMGCKSVPTEVKTALGGNLKDLRLVKKELVQSIPAGEDRGRWLQNVAAFIVRARSLKAWAEDDESFDTEKAMQEELAKTE